MRSRVRSALLWGGAGALSFLVLVQGYALLAEPLVAITWILAVAVVVGLATAAVAYAVEQRLAAWAARRTEERAR